MSETSEEDVRPPKRRGQTTFVLAIGWFTLAVLAAIFARILPLHSDESIVATLAPRTAPFRSLSEVLGTDGIGRSVLSRLVFGARESLIVAVFAVAIAVAIGTLIGVVAGFFRGAVAAVLDVVVNSVLAVPSLVLMMAVVAVRDNFAMIVVAIGVVGVPTISRLARANAIRLAHREHVLAAISLGAGRTRIVLREILPEVVLRVIPYAFLSMAYAILALAALSYLGLGVPPPTPSWGGMLADGELYLNTSPALVAVPGVCIILTVASLLVIGDRLRSRFDSRESVL